MRALAIIVLAGCFDPRLTAHLPCGEQRWCPPPQQCSADGFCEGGRSSGDDAGSDGGGLPEANLVFVSSEPVIFGSMSNAEITTMADQKCQTLGVKLRAGTYVAWLGTSPFDASTRLPSSGGWARPDGQPFTTSANDLLSQGRIFYPARLDDDNEDIVNLRMVTEVAGELNTGDGCAGAGTLLHVGAGDGAYPSWLESTFATCMDALYLYCFETDRMVTPVPPVSNPDLLYAFVTSSAYPVQQGIAALDADCQAAAMANGLGARTFRAFVAPTGAAASSRFAGSAKSWSRLDGVVVADHSLTSLVAPISIDEAGMSLNVDVAFGASSPTAMGADATNCSNWGPGSGTTSAGASTRSNPQAFSGSAITCSSAHLYCLEAP